ncbi:MAG: hypothetical protein HYS09_09920 [Chloroflexi bacterium]|nr:hypothetical protein [Chloroflexota bacterium]
MVKTKFEDVFEECLSGLLSGETTVRECLDRYPQHSERLEPLLETSLELSDAVAVSPSLEYQERARSRFQAAIAERRERAAVAVRPSGWRSWGWAPALVGVAAGVAVLAFVGAAFMSEGGGPLPESPEVQINLPTPIDPALIEQAQRNVQDLESSLQADQVDGALIDSLQDTTARLAASLDDPTELDEATRRAVLEFATRQQELLPQVQGAVPPEKKADVAVILALSETILNSLGATPTPAASPSPSPSATPAGSPVASSTPKPGATTPPPGTGSR